MNIFEQSGNKTEDELLQLLLTKSSSFQDQ